MTSAGSLCSSCRPRSWCTISTAHACARPNETSPGSAGAGSSFPATGSWNRAASTLRSLKERSRAPPGAWAGVLAALRPSGCPAATLACCEQRVWPPNQWCKALLCSSGRPQGAGSALVRTASASQRRMLPQQGQHAQGPCASASPAPLPRCCQGQLGRGLPPVPCSAQSSDCWASRSCTVALRLCSRKAQWVEVLQDQATEERIPGGWWDQKGEKTLDTL